MDEKNAEKKALAIKTLTINTDLKFESVKTLIDPAPVYLTSVRKKDRQLVQQIFDENDQIVGTCPRMLLTPTGLSIDDVIPLMDRLGGIAYPAHVDRDSYSVLSNLGTLPYGYPHG